MHHRQGEKTAEERFNMLARGWLAYPVTPWHTHLPPKSGCINVIPRFALSRRRATALFHNPVCKAQRSVPGFSSTPTSACRRYATSPLSIGLPHPSDCPIGAIHRHRRKTAEERFNMLARGWLAYPVTSMHAHLPPKSGCINVTLDCPIGAIHRHRRKNRRRAVSYVSTGLARLPRDANASPIYRRRAVV